ncbi:MAG: long-chain fatty acid--CoA ligase [Gemmatimonadales bacterium]|nr:MAG: long-chain fatty acid--CoA ligase [Gemmatimonadales bacterium]
MTPRFASPSRRWPRSFGTAPPNRHEDERVSGRVGGTGGAGLPGVSGISGVQAHLAWNSPGLMNTIRRAQARDRPLLLANPVMAGLPGVAGWLRELGFSARGGAEGPGDPRPGEPRVAPVGAPLFSGLPGGFHLLLLTSGTTGQPRLVALDRTSVTWNASTVATHLDLPGDGSLHVALHVPLFHAFGLVLSFLMVEGLGGQATAFRRFEPSAFLKFLEGSVRSAPDRHLLLPFVPAMLRSLPQPADLDPATRSALGRVRGTSIVGGDRVTRTELESLRELLPGVRHTIGYGLTEAGPALAHTAGEMPGADGAVGTALPGVELREGEEGAWEFRSPGQAVAIRERGDAGWLPVRGRFLSTGDLLEVMPGRGPGLRFVGRRSWCFKKGGETVSPVLVEEALEEAWRARFGRPLPCAFVVGPSAGESLVLTLEHARDRELEAAIRAASGELPSFLRPDRIAWVGALPRNALGKVDRGAICGEGPADYPKER